MVSGVAGLMLSRAPALTPAQVKGILMSTATPLPDDPFDQPNAGPNWAGAGRINAAAAVEASVPAYTTAPALQSPAGGTALPGLGSTLSWSNAAGATQVQVQVLPGSSNVEVQSKALKQVLEGLVPRAEEEVPQTTKRPK